jgi:hypothetical protein
MLLSPPAEEKTKDLNTNMRIYDKRPGNYLQYDRQNGQGGHLAGSEESGWCDTMLAIRAARNSAGGIHSDRCQSPAFEKSHQSPVKAVI